MNCSYCGLPVDEWYSDEGCAASPSGYHTTAPVADHERIIIADTKQGGTFTLTAGGRTSEPLPHDTPPEKVNDVLTLLVGDHAEPTVEEDSRGSSPIRGAYAAWLFKEDARRRVPDFLLPRGDETASLEYYEQFIEPRETAQAESEEDARAARLEEATYPPAVVPMILHCPQCGMQHVDAPETDEEFQRRVSDHYHNNPTAAATAYTLEQWRNPPHKTHLCRPSDGGCGHEWRPAEFHTEGVKELPPVQETPDLDLDSIFNLTPTMTGYSDVVIQHNKAPLNYGEAEGETHRTVVDNPTCGDRLTLSLKVEGDRLVLVRWTAEGCAICRACASLLSETVEGATVAEALRDCRWFGLILEGQTPASVGTLVTLATGLTTLPARRNCANLFCRALWEAVIGAEGGER